MPILSKSVCSYIYLRYNSNMQILLEQIRSIIDKDIPLVSNLSNIASILYKLDNITEFKTIKDGSGDDIKISKVNNYEIKSVKQVAQLENITEEAVYNKYIDRIMTTTNAQTSIRTRVWEATGNENDMYIATYIPKSGKNKGKKTDLIFMGKKKVLVIWLKDTSSNIN